MPAINQVHQKFAVVATSGDDSNEARNGRAQTLNQYFDVGSDHCRIGDENANLMPPSNFVGLLRCVRMKDVVKAAGRVPDRCEKLVIPRKDEDVDLASANVWHNRHSSRFQCWHSAGAIADNRCAVLQRFHDYVFGNRLIWIRCLIVR